MPLEHGRRSQHQSAAVSSPSPGVGLPLANGRSDLRGRFSAGGPWLFGDWSIPDAFFTPVAARFRHFQIDLAAHGDDGTAAAYRDVLLAQPDFLEWSAQALSDR